MSYVSATLRQLVTQRAGKKCEYCQFPQTASLFAFEMEHIIAEKHDGITEAKILQFNLLERILERKQLGSIK